jgi:hypothetical protein
VGPSRPPPKPRALRPYGEHLAGTSGAVMPKYRAPDIFAGKVVKMIRQSLMDTAFGKIMALLGRSGPIVAARLGLVLHAVAASNNS